MEVEIKKLDNYGRGITYVDNRICFVENALVGEIVDIDIISNKSKYLEAKVVNYNKVSPDRVKKLCKYYDICGGCDLAHLKIDLENKFKKEKVKSLVQKFTKLDSKIVLDTFSLNKDNYRNKVVFHVDKKELGLYSKKTKHVVTIDECKLLNPIINDLIPIFKTMIKDNEITEIMVRVGNKTDESMVSIKGNVTNYDDLLKQVSVLIINDKVVSKSEKINSYIGEFVYQVSSKSFFQVNSFLTEKLYDELLNNIKKYQSKNVLDLYCGCGTIALYISKYVDKVLGIEIVQDAIDDANINKKLNDVDNVSFICGKVENSLDNIKDIDTIIVDPPRNGLDKNTISNIKKINPNIIIYVSCDPVTLCRDLNMLDEDYDVLYIKPFNMFQNTHHVECVCVLNRR